MPNWELVIGGRTVIPNPFWGGAAFPLLVFGVLFAWPALERRITGDIRRHDLLDRPRDRPIRTAIGAAFLSWVVIVFAVGSTDRIFYRPRHLLHHADPRVASGHLDHPDHGVPSPPRAPAARCSEAARTRCGPGRAPSSAAGPTARWRWSPKAPTDPSQSRPSRRSAPYPGTSSRPGGSASTRLCPLEALLRLAARVHERFG